MAGPQKVGGAKMAPVTSKKVDAQNNDAKDINIKFPESEQKPQRNQQNKDAETKFDAALKAGNAKYHSTGLGEYLISNAIALFSGDMHVGDAKYEDFVTIKGMDKDTTFGDIRMKYNIPKNNISQKINMESNYGGDKDQYKLLKDSDGKPFARFYISDLAHGMGISEDEIKAKFNVD